MAITLGDGPLASRPRDTVNYRIEGPAHRLLFEPFPRRVRALLGGATVLDTTRGMLLHESNLLPQLYVPRTDVRSDLLTPTGHTTHCPFKGDASYWTVTAGGRTADNAVWAYPDPLPDAGWLREYVAPYWNSMDTWLDEDEEVTGHLRNPYTRVDTRRTSRQVRVLAGDEVLAESQRAVLLSETALPNRYYLPADDVRVDLEASDTHTVCPYKGTASYHGVRTAAGTIADAAWSYPEPFDGVSAIRGHLCFRAEGVETWVDGVRVD